MNNTQMDLDFAGNIQKRPVLRRRRRLPNAGWWFGQIRRLINSPDNTPQSRPVQGRLNLAPAR